METAMALTRVLLLFLVYQVAASAASTSHDCAGRAGQLSCDGSCKRLGVCLQAGDWMAMQDCTAQGKVCSRGRCVSWAAECATQTGVRCLAEGLFPALEDCTRYFECADVARSGSRKTRDVAGYLDGGKKGYDGGDGDDGSGDGSDGDDGSGDGSDEDDDGAAEGVVRHCPAGTAFDACTGRCDVLSGGCAWDAPAACSQPGSYGVAPHNDRLFYACVATSGDAVVPYWSRCVLGHFNLTSFRCENYGVPGCGLEDDNTAVAPTPAPPSHTTTEPVTTEPATTTTTAAKCTIGAHPDPATDCSYLFCTPDGTFVVVNCKSGFHFDESAGTCVEGACNKTRLAWILKNHSR